MSTTEDIRKGLDGVYADTTFVSKVMPEINALVYRGYPVQDLAENCSFEEVAHLLLNGELPDQNQLESFKERERNYRQIGDSVYQAIKKFPDHAHPMDTLRSAVSLLSLEDERSWDDEEEVTLDKAMKLLGAIPTIVAADFRRRKGKPMIKPDTSLSFSENFFYMCFGKVPNREVVKAFDVSMILYAEHGFNASTFTARTIVSTQSDLYSGVVGAIGALKGPLHGGANEMVMYMMKEIGEPSKAREWLQDALRQKKKVMGFGHRVYRNGDSRVPTMKKYMKKLAEMTKQTHWSEMADELEQTMIDEKGIYPNLDFPAGPAYYMMDFDINMFTPFFVMARVTGWAAHIREQQANNRIIRPLCVYNGPDERKVTPLEQR